MSEDATTPQGVGMDGDVVERLDRSLHHALEHTEDSEARFHIRQALQFVEVVRQSDA